ncbi:MAG: hypothetical protein GWN07_18580, partial [Actinobacteria bacterium]|nr:hypothetical protein [Actinomycetota bacterium]NIS36746.1 hypothetical protein [Actinomycetota bacterium]NIT98889.1 hypothetical protein [Actinomycetota bacterium]NIU71231.1 hypothetical protein [Actinomycetota bacterium]NIV59083.1 hypothetical protein [Actinomycetota bacterium]
DGARILLVDEWAEMAIDDGRGGLLFQEQRGLAFESSGIETLVWWVPTRAGAAQELLVPAPDQYLELVDAVEIEERLTVFYLRRTFGPDFE